MAVSRPEPEVSATFEVQVVPRSSREEVRPLPDGRYKVAVMAPPVDGEANLAVVRVVAKALGARAREISIVNGHTGRRKTLRVSGLGIDDVRERLG